MSAENKQINQGMVNRPSLDDCPCRTCPDGCYSPFTCDRFMEWAIPEELEEMEDGRNGKNGNGIESR